jgi:hypothetical protein
MSKQEFFTPEETEERLRTIMRGAFNRAPTPLKDIRKINGKIRKRIKNASVANEKNVRPKP